MGWGPGSARFLFRCFRRILALNTRVLERMAEMDRALSGEYVFDKAYLQRSVGDLGSMVHQVAYQLNGMSGEGHVPLYDAYLRIKDALEDILSGGLGPFAGRLAVAFPDIGWELEPLVGLTNVCLALFRHRLDLPAADGFALTTTAVEVLRRQGLTTALRTELEQQATALSARLGRTKALRVVPVPAGPEALGIKVHTQRVDAAEELPEAVAAVLARLPAADRELPWALCVRQDIAAQLAGETLSLALEPGLAPAMRLSVWVPGGEEQERYWLERLAPHGLRRSEVLEKPLDAGLPGGRKAGDVVRGRSRRGSAWLSPPKLALLAELAVAAERVLGAPLTMRWLLDDQGRPVVTGVEPLHAAAAVDDASGDASDAMLGDDAEIFSTTTAPSLLSGGQTGHGGVAAGPVVLVDDHTEPQDVPLGAVVVVRTAAPAHSRLVPRAAALLAEVGTAASHLATVARENRVVSIFGLPGALGLPAGSMVTVDADDRRVYAGVLEPLLRRAVSGLPADSADPEFQVLRRLLRIVRPLRLVDAQAATFAPEYCQSYHDIIHFAHEKAVESLLAIRPEQGSQPRRLDAASPFEIHVLDVGGGLASPSAGTAGTVSVDEVASIPFRAFLSGLLLKEAWRRDPGRLGLRDIFSGFDRSTRALNEAPEFSGRNLAIVGRDYLNLSLRLGYHFSVIDALVTDRPEHNLIYFRFAGGFAQGDRRALRAGLILRVLEALGFKAERKADLVVGKVRVLEAARAEAVLRFLGELTAFTRQLDIELLSETEVERFAEEFGRICGVDCLGREVQ